MSQIWPQDIELAIITRLKDNTNGVQAQLDIIDTARSQTTPEILDANISDERKDENPEIIIDFESADDIGFYFGDDIEEMIKFNPMISVMAILNTSDLDNIKKYMSNYLEAITKSLNNYSTGNITVVLAKSFLIDDLYRDERETTKFAGVRFELLINGGL